MPNMKFISYDHVFSGKSTSPRSAILFHYGKDKGWLKGCVILTGIGTAPQLCKSDGVMNSSENAVKAVREYVASIMRSSNDQMKIKIIYKQIYSECQSVYHTHS